MKVLDGYKTYIGIAGILLTAIAAQYLGADMDDVQTKADTLLSVVDQIFKALALFGGAHKLAKLNA